MDGYAGPRSGASTATTGLRDAPGGSRGYEGLEHPVPSGLLLPGPFPGLAR
jgi:hypothetical protein